MFRIDKFETEGGIRLALAGILNGHAARAAFKVIEGARSENRKLTLDLSQLRFADREGMLFLAAAIRGGVRLTKVPRYIRRWLAQEGLRVER